MKLQWIAANIIIVSVSKLTPLYPNIIHIGSMIHGINIVFPTTAIVVCFRYFFILSNLKDAPSSISESGVAIFETSLIVFSIAVGILFLRSKVSTPKQDAIISGFFFYYSYRYFSKIRFTTSESF